MQAINLCFSNVLHFQKISHLFQITRLVILVIIGLFDISFSQIKRQTIYYHRHKSMVSKVTIAIDGMVPAQPLGPMVFRWFFSQPTIGDNVFQWLQTIGPTMRWKRYIVPVYLDVYTSDVWVNSSMMDGWCNLVPLFHCHLICMIFCPGLIDWWAK